MPRTRERSVLRKDLASSRIRWAHLGQKSKQKEENTSSSMFFTSAAGRAFMFSRSASSSPRRSRRRSLEEILPCADLFILPSAYESFGLAALEAMACGLPVIATEIGGLGEVVASGVDGWLCHVGDIECMSDRAAQLLLDDAKRRAMGEAARKKAVEQFSPNAIVPQYEALYARVQAASPCAHT